MSLEELLGIKLDYLVLALAGIAVVLFILLLVNLSQTRKLKKQYQSFMRGKNGKTLEELVLKRFDQVDALMASNDENKKNIKKIFENNKYVFQKIGLVKYDAFDEMGGRMSFSLALLNDRDDGIVLNAFHSREGCYTYAKEIIAGNAITILSDEEKEALEKAKDFKTES